MKFSVITLLTYAIIIQGAALPQAAVTISTDTPLSTAPNNIVPDSIENHFSKQFDASKSLMVKVDDKPIQEFQKRVVLVIAITRITTIKGIAILIKIVVKNPDYNKYSVVICYNKGYSIRNPTSIIRKVNIKLSLNLLSINYNYIYIYIYI
ncbi:uncharacterized protein EAF02_006002 [Botrytis sinoallii]|uniref:uncharacterized protein n=1 Tax=Botrytis sinoallii TaxID=1463999 RepID=UPI00190267CA|nr:uncharacterized protein EAF02_006002 [Botrytis sinoallii]KAF7882639.1 hypothetical protein EAF02_006002 [Botrytis sinoallii]